MESKSTLRLLCLSLEIKPSEIVAIKRALEPVLRREARERQRSGKRSIPWMRFDVAEILAHLLGRDRHTLARMEAVVAAAEREPGRFGSLLELMERTGNVNGPFRSLQYDLAQQPITCGNFRKSSKNAGNSSKRAAQ